MQLLLARRWQRLLYLFCLWTRCIGVAGQGDPAHWDTVCALAHPAVAALDPRDHIRVYRMCVRLRPFDVEARMGLAEQLMAAGDTESAAHVLYGVLALPVNDAAALDAHNALGVIMDRSQDRPRQAEHHLRSALSIHPAHTPALTNLGMYGCMFANKTVWMYVRACMYAVSTCVLAPTVCMYLVSVHAMHAYIHPNTVARQHARVCECVRMYVCACVFECTGNCLWKQRRSRDALQQFDRALQLEPDEAGHHYSLAAAQFELGQPSSAAAGFRRALALSPSYAAGLLGLGHSLRDLQDPRAAAAAYAAAFDILAAARADQEAGWDARTHATSGPQGDAADECAVGKAAIQAKLLEFSARLAAGDHCNLPADMARACLLAASSSSPLPTLPRASHAFTGGLDEEVVWANMYDVAQLVGPDVIKRLAIARGSALEQHTYGLLLRQAWRPEPPPLPLPTRAHQWLNVVLLSSSLDGDHYVTHAVLNLIAALYAVPAVSAARPRLRMHVISTAKFNVEFPLPPSPLAAPARDHGHWGCSLGSAGGGGIPTGGPGAA